MAVTKNDIIKAVHKKTAFSRGAVTVTMKNLLDCIRDILKEGRNIEIRGFGTFIPKTRKPHLARNPKKPDHTLMLPERVVPILKFSNEIKSKLNFTSVVSEE
jgi:nucleoid DNA-binding protein